MVNTPTVSASERQHMIAEAAYFLAENRGFGGGDPVANWLQAEAEVNARLGEAQQFEAQFEERLEAISQHMKAARKKLSSMTAEVRQDWERDLARLAKLRDGFQEKLHELHREGMQASEKTRKQLEKTWEEAGELLQRLDRSVKK